MTSRNRKGKDRRRGFAMLLVLVSLAIATILATAYLASRDNSAMIGRNIASGASAKSAALATMNTGIAILETQTDWRNNHTNGVVFSDALLAGARVDLTFMDLITGNPPDSNSTDVAVIATARVDGMQETITAHAHVPPAEKSPDVDYSEFAVFALEKITVKDTSLIGRWFTSPAAVLGRQIKIGTLSTSAGAVTISDSGVALDTVIYHVPAASSMVVTNSGPTEVQTSSLPDTPTIPAPPSTGVSPFAWPLPDSLSRSGGSVSLSSNRRYDDVGLRSGAILNLQSMTLTVQDDLTIESGGGIRIRGDVKIVVFDNVSIGSSSSIELEPGATLEMYIGGDLEMVGGAINELDIGVVRDNSGEAVWMHPSNVRIYSHLNAQNTWKLDSNAIIKGEIYATSDLVIIDDDSALYGRVMAREVELSNNGAVYYDHVLDSDNGYTTFNGAMYDINGNIHAAVKAMTSLNGLTVAATKTIVRLANEANAPILPPSATTPRTVNVTYEIVSYSSDVQRWETKASLLASED